MPRAKIVSVDYPSEASPSEEITVTVKVHNEGSAGTIFVRANTPDGFRGATFRDVATCDTVSAGIIFYMPASDVTLVIEAGSGSAYSPEEITDTRTITIRVKRESTSGFNLVITYIDAPAEAPPNENVYIDIHVKNNGSGGGNGWLWFYIDNVLYYVYDFGYIESGGERSVRYGIIMPDRDITVTVYVGEGTPSNPISITDTKSVTIKKKVVVGVFNLVIEKIDFPSEVDAGSYVSGSIYVRNIGGGGNGYIKVHVYDSVSTLGQYEYNFGFIEGGGSRRYSFSFYIFSKDAVIDVEVGEGTVSNPIRVTDRKSHVVKVKVSRPTHLFIDRLEYPSEARIGDSVTVKAVVVNSGDYGKGYIRFVVYELGIDETNEFYIDRDQSVERSISFVMPSTTVIGTVIAGVVKDGEYIPTSNRVFTISPVSVPPEVPAPPSGEEEEVKPIDKLKFLIPFVVVGGAIGILLLSRRGE